MNLNEAMAIHKHLEVVLEHQKQSTMAILQVLKGIGDMTFTTMAIIQANPQLFPNRPDIAPQGPSDTPRSEPAPTPPDGSNPEPPAPASGLILVP